MDLLTGAKVRVRAHTSHPGEGLSYPEMEGILMEDANSSEGWDVVDICTPDGEFISIYCFSIQRTE